VIQKSEQVDLQPRLNELLIGPIDTFCARWRKIFLAIVQQDTWSTIGMPIKLDWKVALRFWAISKKRLSKNRQISKH